jgi:hypothetical protein
LRLSICISRINTHKQPQVNHYPETAGFSGGRPGLVGGVADTAARKPLKRLTFARSARNTPLMQGVEVFLGGADKGGDKDRDKDWELGLTNIGYPPMLYPADGTKG